MNTNVSVKTEDKPERQCRGVFDLHIFKNGVEIEHFVEHNLIVNSARTAMAHLVGSADATKKITQFGIGTDNTEPDLANTSLTNVFQKDIDSVVYPEDDEYNVQFNFSLSVDEGNDMEITEFGLMCADGSLFARKVRKAISKDSDISLTGSWTIMF